MSENSCCLFGCGVILFIPFFTFKLSSELVLAPISIPCSIYRTYKYNKLIKKWYLAQSEPIQKICDSYFCNKLSYKTITAKYENVMSKAKKIANRNKVINQQDLLEVAILERELIYIPKFILSRKRYLWNTVPHEKHIFISMDNMMYGIKIRLKLFNENNKNKIDII